jgi:YVTN family beta-propeller protein
MHKLHGFASLLLGSLCLWGGVLCRNLIRLVLVGYSQSRLSDLIIATAFTLLCLCLQAVSFGWRTSAAKLPVASPKLASSAIALTPDGKLLLAVNPDSNTVTIVDTALGSPLVEISVGVEPRSVAVLPTGERAFIANFGSDTVSVFDLEALHMVQTLPVGDRPAGVLASPDERFIAISEMGADRVRFLDAVTLETLTILAVADRPYGLAFTPDSSRLLVTHLLSGSVTVLNVQPYTAYLPQIVYQHPAKTLARSGLERLTDQTEVSFQGECTGQPAQVMISTWPNIASAASVLVNASGSRAYLPQTMANGLGLNTQFDTTVFPKVSVINLQTDTHQTDEHISLPETDRPVGLPWDAALAKDDRELWVVNSASNDVSVIDLSSPSFPTRIANIPVGDNPRGIIISPEGNNVYVNNTLAGTVSVIDANTYTVTQVITATTIPLPPALLNGKKLYFSSARPELAQARWISCNTCHVEGEQDGRNWKLQYLGEVPPGEQAIITRNTTSLLGMIETYPLRWSAEWDESADSEFSVRFEQFGSGLIDGDMHPTLGTPNQGRSYDLDCLALYIDSLAVPASSRGISDAGLRGKLIFESEQTQCSDCHPTPLYTDLQVHDVGTADGQGEWFGPLIDTPTLRFLYDSAPYLHDGSAPTLYEVLTSKNPEDEHGTTSHLTEGELLDLVAYLLALP